MSRSKPTLYQRACKAYVFARKCAKRAKEDNKPVWRRHCIQDALLYRQMKIIYKPWRPAHG